MPKETILIVEDDLSLLKTLEHELANPATIGERGKPINVAPFRVITAQDPATAEKIIHDATIDFAFIDINLSPGEKREGLELIRQCTEEQPTTGVIAMSGYYNQDLIKSAIHQYRAIDFILKPLSSNLGHTLIFKCRPIVELRRLLNSAIAQAGHNFGKQVFLASKSKLYQEHVIRKLQKLRGNMNNLLLRGESGVGKEIVARYAWSLEGDTNRPFVTVHASAVNSQTFESELFGHKKGSFTGAAADKEGMFALAHTGDLFLDEIGTWEEAIQIKLLRFLEYREITPVGGATRKIRTRAIAATNTDLEEAVRMGTFRHDLYERIRALTIFIPPLRDRKEDIPDLVEIFSEEFARQTGHKVKLSNEAMSFAVDYHWTGNVRQLKGVMECLAYDFDTKDVSLGQFKDNIANYGTAALATSPQDKKEPILERETVKLGSHKLLMLKYEQDVIRAALAASEDIPSAAKLLQISRSGIYKKLQQWGWWDALTMSKNKQEQQ